MFPSLRCFSNSKSEWQTFWGLYAPDVLFWPFIWMWTWLSSSSFFLRTLMSLLFSPSVLCCWSSCNSYSFVRSLSACFSLWRVLLLLFLFLLFYPWYSEVLGNVSGLVLFSSESFGIRGSFPRESLCLSSDPGIFLLLCFNYFFMPLSIPVFRF